MASGKFRENVIVNEFDHDKQVAKAKETASKLLAYRVPVSIQIFNETDIRKIESGVKQLNELSNKCWLASAIAIYSIIYTSRAYEEEGFISWEDYISHSKERLGLEQREVSEQLSSARYFIRYHKELEKAGWSPVGSARKLARAELALELTNDNDLVIEHLVEDSWRDFKDWYSGYKQKSIKLETNTRNIEYSKNILKLDGKEVLRVNKDLDKDEKDKFEDYIKKICEALRQGDEPAIIPVYDKKEALVLIRLRDKNRQGK